MGKNKAQRTKNNAKPSSSGRSAELLGTSMPNFVGFSAVKDGGYVPVLPGFAMSSFNEVEINTIDPQFQVVLKKMNKKDATTKYKALQEFADLCKYSTVAMVEAVVPFWPRLYCNLCNDLEHRVREAAQLAHGALVKRIGRGIALYLKQLAGPWFASQFDTYPPAASAALNSFQTTFPDKKYVDAIVHCQDEILAYIYDNIVIQSPQSMANHKSGNLTADELETKYQRLLTCSLQGYCCYLKNIPKEQIEKTRKVHEQMISNSSFWKLIKYEVPMIKTGLFNVLAAIIDNTKDLINNEKKRIMTTIMNSLDEIEPGVLSAVWECMLIAIDKLDDWHLVVSIEKLVLPKLWRVLRNGGQGCASVIYPSLLPFFSQFKKFNMDKKEELFIKFFENMRQGFNVKTVQISRSEMTAISKAFTECLRYAVLLNCNDNSNLCDELLKKQILVVLEQSIDDYTVNKSILFTEITELISYWSKNRDNNEYKHYNNLIKIFWNDLELIFKRIIDENNQNYDTVKKNKIYDAQMKFLISLKHNKTHRNLIRSKKNNRVKFVDTVNEDDDSNEDDTGINENEMKLITSNDESDNDHNFNREFESFINNLCITFMKNINDTKSINNIDYLYKLVSNFESKELIISIIKSYRNDENILEFYNDTLKCWLLNNTNNIKSIIQLIFIFIKYMNENEREIVLNSFSNLNDKDKLNNTIICSLSDDQNRSDKSIINWLKGNHITNHLKLIADEIIIDQNYNELNEHLILLIFKSFNGHFYVNEIVINNIAELLCSNVKSLNDNSVNTNIIKLISKLLKSTSNYTKLIAGSLKMLIALFELSVMDLLPTSELKDSVRDDWKNGFISIHDKLTSKQLAEVHENCFKIIYDKLYSLNNMSIEEIIDITLDFIESSNSNNYQESLVVAIQFNNCSENILFKEWIPHATDLILHGEIISGDFYRPNPIKSLKLDSNSANNLQLNDEILPNKIENCLQWALLNSQIINILLNKLEMGGNEDINDEIDSPLSNDLKNLPQVLKNILWITSLGDLYSNHYRFAKNYDSVSKIQTLLAKECHQLRSKIPKYIWDRILTQVLDVDEYWSEYSSIFVKFLHYLTDNQDQVMEMKSEGTKILLTYLETDDLQLKTIDHLRAVILARNFLKDEDNHEICLQVLLRMIKRNKSNEFLLLNKDITCSTSWEDFYLVVEVINLFTSFINSVPTKMDHDLWDSTIIFLASWQLSLNKSQHHFEDLKVKCFIASVMELFVAVQSLMNKQEIQPSSELPLGLLDEWKNVFAEDIYQGIGNTWMFFADLFNEQNELLIPNLILNYLGGAVKLLDGKTFFEPSEGNNQPNITSDQLLKFSLKLLSSPIPSLQLSAYYSLNILVPTLVDQDKRLIEGENFDLKLLNIYKLEEILINTQKIVDIMLMDFKLCDIVSCTVQSYTDSYTYTFAYLLAWSLVLNMCGHAHADLRYQYGEILKDNLFPSLMNNIFRLMPGEILQDNKSRITNPQIVEMFTKQPVFNFSDNLSEWKLDHLVCWIYINCLRDLPVLARQWWSSSETRVSNTVERITVQYVSPILCQEELLNKKLQDVANLQIKIHPSAREVVALYQMDDTKLELSMVLPANHPLSSVVVEPGQHAGGAANWRNCHMQLSIFLTHQNGTIWDGLMMWKKNLDKKFSGVEECYICFSIFHINTYQIPKLSCYTCRKKFHAPCLYKWFSTSQKSTCPICRNIF